MSQERVEVEGVYETLRKMLTLARKAQIKTGDVHKFLCAGVKFDITKATDDPGNTHLVFSSPGKKPTCIDIKDATYLFSSTIEDGDTYQAYYHQCHDDYWDFYIVTVAEISIENGCTGIANHMFTKPGSGYYNEDEPLTKRLVLAGELGYYQHEGLIEIAES